ncbi:uncharacterized protein LOC121494828 [Vulpes lagopus]|uniref:uncharacterized protein LOC121494828 n=1 Tax=Vulpes lagopus TaxID=494514 RepID=UPI001BC950EA|nr:uncharacterized protein LOC121494828 [Vulpes lagopus]XP_041617742.1 uncharacterized protein LOC121494828 [Vulpes lagopus]
MNHPAPCTPFSLPRGVLLKNKWNFLTTSCMKPHPLLREGGQDTFRFSLEACHLSALTLCLMGMTGVTREDLAKRTPSLLCLAAGSTEIILLLPLPTSISEALNPDCTLERPEEFHKNLGGRTPGSVNTRWAPGILGDSCSSGSGGAWEALVSRSQSRCVLGSRSAEPWPPCPRSGCRPRSPSVRWRPQSPPSSPNRSYLCIFICLAVTLI